jgi:DNA invertase Pin-like site-specific DNA recombinase
VLHPLKGDAFLVGYARVSTLEQHIDLQLDVLTHAGCEKIFRDTISGAKSERPGLSQAIEFMRQGDVLVVWKLDRLGRFLRDLIDIVSTLRHQGIGFRVLQEAIDTTTPTGELIFHIFGALAEFERALIRLRTRAGLVAARAQGRKGGRPRKFTAEQERQIAVAMSNRATTMAELRNLFKASDTTLRRIAAKHREGVVNLLPIDRINEHEGTRLPGASVLWGGGKARDFLPGIASFPHLLTVFRGREEVTARAEVWGDGTIDREAALGVTRGCKPLPAPFARARRLVGMFGALGGAVALQLIRDAHPGDVVAPVQQRTDALRRGLLVAPRLDEAIPPSPVLLHSAPEVVPRAIDRAEDLIQVPGVARSGPLAPELMGNILATRQTPWAHGFLRDDDSPGEPPLFDIAIAEAEAGNTTTPPG